VTKKTSTGHRRLVSATVEKLREIILAHDPDTQIGSLPELAQQLGVGIVTIQQAARILEHQGLLDVRRGPGGGYYGRRPDEAALEQTIAAYVYVHGHGDEEAREIGSLLHCQLAAAAADCGDDQLREELRALGDHMGDCDTEVLRVDFEEQLHNLLCRMADRPLIELLTRVVIRLYRSNPQPPILRGDEELAVWKLGRLRVINAVLDRDRERALFEAQRNRTYLLERVKAPGSRKQQRRRS
jgi:GntR family transcriptional repressor for pyruvate dehydrogenase complex